MTTLSPPAGNPAALDDSVRRLLTTERALEDAARDLAASVAEGSGRAVDAVQLRSGRAQAALVAAHVRYQGARAGLQDYAIELHRFHRDAYDALDSDAAAQVQLHHAQQQRDEAQWQWRHACLNPGDAATIDWWRHAYDQAQRSVAQAQQASATAHAQYGQAAARLDCAAATAKGRIVAAFDGTNDGWRDYLGEAFDGIVHLIADITQWAESYFREVLAVVVDAVAAFLAAVVLAVGAILLAVVLTQLLTIVTVAVAAVLVSAIVIILAALAEVLLMMRVGAAALSVADALGLEGSDRIRFVALAVAAACPPLALFILSRVLNEVSKPPPEVKKLNPAILTAPQRKALGSLEESTPATIADLLTWAGQVDTVGGDTQAVVDVARVVSEAGEVSWIVTLPSTEDWVFLGDAGAPNDLDADLMLLLFPELRSQYEVAVLDAMEQAGIPQDEPVVLTGWSLGGIMGGSLIEAQAGGYQYAGLVCGGSPIDHMAIDAQIPVVQVKHTLDPAHRADLIDAVPDTAHHVSLWDGSRSHGASTDLKRGNVIGHHNGDYVDTLTDHLAYNALHGGPDLNDDFAEVLPWDDPNTPQHVRIEHTQYAFHE